MWFSAEIRRLLRTIAEQKARIASLEDDLRQERERARQREDALLDRVLTAAGRHGIAQVTQSPKEKPEVKPVITAIDEARLAALRDAAVRAGRPASDGDAMWRAQLNGKMPSLSLPDEPFVLPTE